MDLTEAENIKKRWQEYTEEIYQKDLHDTDNHDGVITHQEPEILECEVKWALGSITRNKASGGDGIPVELFQILKDDGVQVLHSICQHIWETQQWPQDWKRSVFIPIPKKGNAKLRHNCTGLSSVQFSRSVMSNSFTTSRPLCPWDCPGQNTGVDCHFLLEGIFLAQGSNPSLLQCSWILYQLSHQGSPCFGRLFLPNNVVLSIYYVPGSAPQAGKGYTQLFVCFFLQGLSI